MNKKLKLLVMQGAIVCLLPFHATAQTAVPLEPSLLDWTWWVTDFAGKRGSEMPAPTFKMEDDNRVVLGTAPCGTDWRATVELNFPKIKISDVRASAYDCPEGKDITTFLNVLEKADRFHTGPEGLEILDRNGRRVILMVSGG